MRSNVLVALATLSGFACTPQPTLPEGTLEPIRIGVVTSLSGSLGSAGPGWLNAARLAEIEVNAAGGPLPGRRIEIVVRDDETETADDGALARQLARELIEEEGVIAIVGA